MRYRLAVELPRELDVGKGVYVLDLVEGDGSGGCWLRLHERDEPVVFLLARFPNRASALASLSTGFDVADQPLPLRVMTQLVAEGGAQLAPRNLRPRVPTRVWTSRDVGRSTEPALELLGA